MKLTKEKLVALINEELSRVDKSEIKKMIDIAVEKGMKRDLKKVLEDELVKALKSKEIKGDIGEIAKKVIKKLYKDLSFHHPYIIDRIKV
jgi:transcriptional accessory protein Tex/SPT6